MSAALAKLLTIGLEPFGLRYDALALADEKRLGLFAYAIVAIGPIEELAKLLPFLLVVLRRAAVQGIRRRHGRHRCEPAAQLSRVPNVVSCN